MPRIVKDYDDRYAEFVDVAERLFLSQGYEQTTVQQIIDTVGVAKGTFYHYFDSKQAILEAVVAELTTQALARFEAIVDDESLNAIQKWSWAMRRVADWKIGRRDELLAFLRLVHADDNVLLLHKLRMQRAQMTVPILARIIEQGVEEGLFETPCVREMAEMVYAVAEATSAGVTGILLNPQNYDCPETLVRRKMAALQTATERILGADPGSLPMADEQILAPWFADWEATRDPDTEK
ncbi:MAG: TetR/AcrR family transcriptional regulator [Anaerolineae bacterium]